MYGSSEDVQARMRRSCSPMQVPVGYFASPMKLISPLAVGAFGCNSVLITLHVIFKQKYVIKAVKVVLEQFKLAK